MRRSPTWIGLMMTFAAAGCQTGPMAFDPAPDATEQSAAAPKFASTDPASPAPVQFAGGVSLWGDLPGADRGAPINVSDNLRQVSFTLEGADFDLDIDPTGKTLVYASTQHRHTSDLYLKRVDGATVTQLTNDAGNDVMPTFSPDGTAVAFCSDRAGNWDIYIQKLDGGQPVQVTSDLAQELHPSFSPDGRQIVFCALGGQSGQWEIVVVDVDNPARRRFIGYGLFPSFSPTGEKIAYQRARHRGSRTFSIWTIDYAGGEGTKPTEIAAAANAACINPCWSPDGRRLAFATVVNPPDDPNTRPESAELWSVAIDGTQRVKLTNDTFANLQPVWGRDGVLYFVSNRNGAENIWALRPNHQPAVAGQPTAPAPSPEAPAAKPAGKPTAEVPTP